jgi:hypothetical protein
MVGQRAQPMGGPGKAELLDRAVSMVNSAVALLNEAIEEIKRGDTGEGDDDERDVTGAPVGDIEQPG